MILTEEEAKTKWCPFAWRVMEGDGKIRGALRSGSVVGPENTPAPMCRCIASECQAWRWVNSPPTEDTFMRDRNEPPFSGYCGLAGKPSAGVA